MNWVNAIAADVECDVDPELWTVDAGHDAWYLMVVGCLRTSLEMSSAKWTPEDRLLTSIFRTGSEVLTQVHQSMRATRKMTAIVEEGVSPIELMAAEIKCVRALIAWRRLVEPTGAAAWLLMSALHAIACGDLRMSQEGADEWSSTMMREREIAEEGLRCRLDELPWRAPPPE